MGFAERLIFQGLIWPNVEIAGREAVSYSDLGKALGNAPTSMARFHVPTVKPPRPVFYDAPLPWWRNFAENIDFDDDTSVLTWARRHGDPFAEAPIFRPIDTRQWPWLAFHLDFAARLWSDPDDDENNISRLRFDTGAGGVFTSWVLNSLLDRTKQVDWTPKVNEADGSLEIRPTVRTLEQFMVLSAVFDIHNSTLMKRCQRCRDWFSPNRTDAQFCSSACRQAAFQAAKVTVTGQEVAVSVGSVSVIAGTGVANKNRDEKK